MKSFIKKGAVQLTRFRPATVLKELRIGKIRGECLDYLNTLSRSGTESEGPLCRNVLVDGFWDNPNYWTRFSLVRRALQLWKTNETGLVGEYSRARSKSAFRKFGIDKLVDFKDLSRIKREHIASANDYISTLTSADDFLDLDFPQEYPAELVYDAMLKRQRRATLDLNDKELVQHLAGALASIEAAENIFIESSYDLVILSHALDYTYASIAWSAINRGISVLVLYGDYGTARFFHLKDRKDLLAYPGRPTEEEIEATGERKRRNLEKEGRETIHARMSGETNDVGAIYAYQKRISEINRKDLCDSFGWDHATPVIGVYNSNWFDYPHASGLKQYRDFLDWIEITLAVAKETRDVNWVFKAHPCDDWYASINGIRLEDLVETLDSPNIKLANKAWNGSSLIESLDGIITCHGTIGIEATSMGTPVMVVHPGWYGHAGFVVSAKDKKDYVDLLKTSWWLNIETESAKQKANEFSGWMFCIPDWQKGYVFDDDSLQDEIYKDLIGFMRQNNAKILREVGLIKDWFVAGHKYFHIYKILKSEAVTQAVI